MKNKKSEIEKFMKSNIFVSKITYDADGGGDSLNEENIEIILKSDVDCKVDFEDEGNYKNVFFNMLTDMCQMGRGWYNDDGGKIELEIDFENERLMYNGEAYYSDSNYLGEKNKIISSKDINNNIIGEDEYFKNIIEKMKKEKITEISFSFYGRYDDFSCDLEFIDEKEVKYGTDEYKFFIGNDFGIMNAIESFEAIFFNERGGDGEIKITLLKDGDANINVDLSETVEGSDGASDDISFDEVFSEIESDTSGSYMSDILEVAKTINDIVAGKVEKKDLTDSLKNIASKNSNSSIKL